MKRIKNSTLCYIEKDDKYLMLHRTKKPNDPNEGKWIGVGGKVEKGETPRECVIREVLEETGLILKTVVYHGLVHFVSDVWEDEEMYLYTSDDFEGEVCENCAEGILRWVPKSQVPELPTWEGDRIFLKYLLENQKGIELTLRYEGEKLAEVIEKRTDKFGQVIEKE